MTASVQLTPIEIDKHAQLLFDWRTNPDIYRFMYSPGPQTMKDHLAWLKKIDGDQSHHRQMVEYGGRAVGTAALVDIDLRHSRALFDMYIGDPRARIRGVGAAAEILYLDFAFDKLNLNKVSCEVFCGNQPAIQMHLRMGFSREGILRQHAHTDEGWMDVARLSILRAEWAESRMPLFAALNGLIASKQTTHYDNDTPHH